MTKNLLSILFIFSCYLFFAQTVTIPDAKFKAYLVGNIAINTNNDSEIQIAEAEAYTGVIDCSKKNIANLTGIESFKNITILICSNNQLTNLDVSKNTALQNLVCDKNQLTSLDISKNLALQLFSCFDNQLKNLDVTKNTVLTRLSCSSNQITSLDVSKNIALKHLDCSRNQISSLDVSKNVNLTLLACITNKLTSLDVTKNISLTILSCSNNELISLDISKNTSLDQLLCFNNQITSLDVSKNTELTFLWCNGNQLTSLDVSKNSLLLSLYCYSNQLTSLDMSDNKALEELRCYSNQLTNLNVKNGENIKIIDFNSTINPNLTCIQVDNPTAAHVGWDKDSTAIYSANCNDLSVNNTIKSSIAIYPNPVRNKFTIKTEENIRKVEIYSVNGQLLKISFQKETQISDLPKGNYIVKITTDKEVKTEKIIKE